MRVTTRGAKVGNNRKERRTKIRECAASGSDPKKERSRGLGLDAGLGDEGEGAAYRSQEPHRTCRAMTLGISERAKVKAKR
jgi:hypothetical protein